MNAFQILYASTMALFISALIRFHHCNFLRMHNWFLIITQYIYVMRFSSALKTFKRLL